MPRSRRPGDMQWRHQTPRNERGLEKESKRLLRHMQVVTAVEARTGGICYIPGCRERIISYPHAVPHDEGGVHHPVNRAGVCQIHRVDASRRKGEQADKAFRLRLQAWLIDWYGQFGISPEDWWAMARGQAAPLEAERGLAHG